MIKHSFLCCGHINSLATSLRAYCVQLILFYQTTTWASASLQHSTLLSLQHCSQEVGLVGASHVITSKLGLASGVHTKLPTYLRSILPISRASYLLSLSSLYYSAIEYPSNIVEREDTKREMRSSPFLPPNKNDSSNVSVIAGRSNYSCTAASLSRLEPNPF